MYRRNFVAAVGNNNLAVAGLGNLAAVELDSLAVAGLGNLAGLDNLGSSSDSLESSGYSSTTAAAVADSVALEVAEIVV